MIIKKAFLAAGFFAVVNLMTACGNSKTTLSKIAEDAQQPGMEYLQDFIPSKDCFELGKQMAIGNVSTDVGMTSTCNANPAGRDLPPSWMPYEKFCSRTQGLPCNKSTNGL